MKNSQWLATIALLLTGVIVSTTSWAQTKPTRGACLKECATDFGTCIGIDTPETCEKDRLKCNSVCEQPPSQVLNFDSEAPTKCGCRETLIRCVKHSAPGKSAFCYDNNRKCLDFCASKTARSAGATSNEEAPGAPSVEERSMDEPPTGATSREETPAEEPSPAAKAGKMICPPTGECALSGDHYNKLLLKIRKLQKRLKSLKEQIEAVENRPDNKAEINILEQKQTTILIQLQTLEKQLVTVRNTPTSIKFIHDPIPKWAGWHWGVGLSVGGQIFSGSEHSASTLELLGFAKWLDPSHFGLEVGLGIGAWFTEGLQPFTACGHLYGIAGWESFGLLLGPRLSFMQSPVDGKRGYMLASLDAGAEFRIVEDVLWLRLTLGAPLYTELLRFGGIEVRSLLNLRF